MKKLLAILLALFAIATMCVSCSKKEEEDDSWKDSYMQEDNENIDHIQVNDETFYFEAVDSESVAITGYEKSAAVEPYYAAEGDPLFDRLQAIIDGDLVLDALRTNVVEVKLWQEGEGGFPAVKEEVCIEVTSYGGDTTGYQIPFVVHYTGIKQKGIFDLNTKTFTAAENE